MVALNKRRLRREIDKARREAFEARLGELRELIKEARVARTEAIKSIKSDCALKRVELRQSCQTRAAVAKASGASEVAQRRSKLLEEKGFEQKMRAHERPRALRSTTGERRQESDDEVRTNLQPDMVPVFNAVRRFIKGAPRKSRTEAFLQWAEENPGEVWELLQHDADRHLANLLAEQERTEKVLRRRKLPPLSAVPF
jgi:hypothetical protein